MGSVSYKRDPIEFLDFVIKREGSEKISINEAGTWVSRKVTVHSNLIRDSQCPKV